LTLQQIEQLQGIITNCLGLLYQNDNSLETKGGMELSVSLRLALYLQEAIKNIEWLNGLNIDIEYNKNGMNPKKTPRSPNGARPDLIIHSRGNNDANVLTVEIKGWWNGESREIDIIKLEDFTHQEGEYKYGLGVFLELKQAGYQPQYIKDYQ
jgi:hypothetical protein